MAVFNNPPPAESEDCLYLNVYSPSAPGQGRAVMYWIYGGSLQFGTAGQIYYDEASFASYQDIIIVSVNYRTNGKQEASYSQSSSDAASLRIPNSPELPNTGQNLSFYDQRAGLEWVQRNIAQFGGDPNKVTIFGESAGAVSVDALVTSFAHNPPFRAAIMQSGQISVRPPFTNSTASWLKLAAGVGCPTALEPSPVCARRMRVRLRAW
jgi:carboxylesterase type B